jgi:hypothetical protein
MRPLLLAAAFMLGLVSPCRASEQAPLLFFITVPNKAPAPGSTAETATKVVRGTIRDRIASRLPNILDTALKNVDVADDRGDVLVKLCSDNGARAIVQASYTFKYAQKSHSTTRVDIALRDCGDLAWGSVSGTAEADAGQKQLEDLVAEATDDAVSRLARSWSHIDTTAHKNFLTSGLLMEDESRTALFLLKPCDQAACVRLAEPFGTAARAGLRRDDVVLSLNGTPTAGKSAEQLGLMIKTSASYSVVVKGVDGATRTLSFDSQPAAWYATHPLTP